MFKVKRGLKIGRLEEEDWKEERGEVRGGEEKEFNRSRMSRRALSGREDQEGES